jgi:hypothetical protein
MDLTDIIHEHVLSEQSLIDLEGLKIWAPKDQYHKFEACFYSCMARVVDQDLFKSLIKVWSKNQLTVTGLNNDLVQFSFNGEHFQLTTQEFLTGIWGPNKLSEFSTLGPELFFSGLDSI